MAYVDNPILYVKKLLDNEQVWEGEATVGRGETLVNTGVVNRKLYFVNYGALRATVTVDDEEHTIRLAYDGSFFGSLDSFLTGSPSKMKIEAIKSSTLLYLEHDTLHTFFSSSAKYTDLWQEFLSVVIVQQLEREVDLLTASPEVRYQRVLSRSPQVFQYIPHKYIAAYLRMAPETLSRIRKS